MPILKKTEKKALAMTIAKIFGKSPFAPLQAHIKKVSDCIDLLPSLFEAVEKNREETILKIAKKISKLEHEADLTKNDIRNHLPKSLFLPIDRGALLEILALQDSLADQAEDIAVVCTLAPLEKFSDLQKPFFAFFEKNIKTFHLVQKIIEEFNTLIESSFGGLEAEKVKEMIDLLCTQEHEADKLQYDLVKQLYSVGNKMSCTSFHLWMSLLKEVAAISNLSEKLGMRIRMILELK